jgi:hypothetical protein
MVVVQEDFYVSTNACRVSRTAAARKKCAFCRHIKLQCTTSIIRMHPAETKTTVSD